MKDMQKITGNFLIFTHSTSAALKQNYDDRYDGRIDESLFQKKLSEYKERERAIVQEMEQHVNADESFHITANMVLNLARRARGIFESSEVEEKRQLLNFVFQNFELKDKKLSITLREPFKIIKDTFQLRSVLGCADPRTALELLKSSIGGLEVKSITF